MATNTSGYEITVGPDVDGKYFTVEPGADYDEPTPPTVIEEPPAREEVEGDPPAPPAPTTPTPTVKPAPTTASPAAPPATAGEPADPQKADGS